MLVYICIALDFPGPMKFTALIDDLEEQNKSISRKHKDFKILLELAIK